MRSWVKLSAVLAIFATIGCNAQTYWVDGSCTSKENWPEYLNEAKSMAAASSARLASTTDTDFAAVFERIFKVDKSDAEAVDQVQSKSKRLLDRLEICHL